MVPHGKLLRTIASCYAVTQCFCTAADEGFRGTVCSGTDVIRGFFDCTLTFAFSSFRVWLLIETAIFLQVLALLRLSARSSEIIDDGQNFVIKPRKNECVDVLNYSIRVFQMVMDFTIYFVVR